MKSTNFFAEQFFRLKEALAVREDQDVAAALGMTKAAFSARKTRNSFPETELYALAAKRPDLGLDVDYVLTGITREAQALMDAEQKELERFSDAHPEATFAELRAAASSAKRGATAQRIQLLVNAIAGLRDVEFDAVWTLVQSITQQREALEKAAPKKTAK